jgi:hypothetical protein
LIRSLRVALLAALTACGSAPNLVNAPSVAPVKASDAPVADRVKHHAKLHFELGGRPFPLPLVHGTVSGEPTWMLVDTGANSHVVAGWLARKAHLEMRNLGDVGTDHTGRTIATSRVDHPKVLVEEWGALPDGPILVTEVPEAVARLGIGAFISPQALGAEDGAIVLDLKNAEMHDEDAAQAKAFIESPGADIFKSAHACADDDSPIKGLAFVIPATIEGTRAALLLDTGAHHTDLLISTSIGKRLLPRSIANREQVYAASGKIVTRTVRTAKLSIGQYTVTTDIDLIPGESDSSCPRDGVLAMDILRSCVIVLEQAKVFGRCGG